MKTWYDRRESGLNLLTNGSETYTFKINIIYANVSTDVWICGYVYSYAAENIIVTEMEAESNEISGTSSFFPSRRYYFTMSMLMTKKSGEGYI